MCYSARLEVEALLIVGDAAAKNSVVNLLHSFTAGSDTWLVFPLLGRDLFSLVHNSAKEHLPQHAIRSISYQLCCAVAFLHSKFIVHTDIKLDNIVFVDRAINKPEDLRTRAATIKIIDLGCCIKGTWGMPEAEFEVSARPYRAPEVVRGVVWSSKVDVWSLGLILYEMHTLCNPFWSLYD